MLCVKKHLDELLTMFKENRNNPDKHFDCIFARCSEHCEKFGLQVTMPRVASRQTYRENYNLNNVKDYYRVSLFIPYLDSLIQSISVRFSEETTNAFLLSGLHPVNMKVKEENMKNLLFSKKEEIAKVYEIDNFAEELETWFELWERKEVSENLDFKDILASEVTFFPAVKKAINIFLALPPTTATIERSFSTLRRVKSWLRSTMSEDRLSGLCMLSVHKQFVLENKELFINQVLDQFGQERRRLKFLFQGIDSD